MLKYEDCVSLSKAIIVYAFFFEKKFFKDIVTHAKLQIDMHLPALPAMSCLKHLLVLELINKHSLFCHKIRLAVSD